MREDVSEAIAAALRRRAPEGWAWLERRDWLAGFAGAGRRFAGASGFSVDEAMVLDAAGVAAPEDWSLAEAARVWLLLTAAGAVSADALARLFRTSDNAERAAILKALVLLPDPGAHVGLAVEALRTHVQDVFEALACDNAYPAAWLPDPNFNQMVLKALFTGAPLARVRRLADRLNPALVRMAADYAAERRAAGRPVPSDIALITGVLP